MCIDFTTRNLRGKVSILPKAAASVYGKNNALWGEQVSCLPDSCCCHILKVDG